MLVLVLSHVSLRVSGCAVSMGEAVETYLFRGVTKVVDFLWLRSVYG